MNRFGLVLLASVLVLALVACSSPASSTTTFNGSFAAATGVTTSGSGSATATLEGDQLTVEGDFKDLAGEFTVAHLHRVDGVVFAVTVTASADGKSGTFTGGDTLSAADMTALEAGTLYVNIHSSEATGGEIQAFLKN